MFCVNRVNHALFSDYTYRNECEGIYDFMCTKFLLMMMVCVTIAVCLCVCVRLTSLGISFSAVFGPYVTTFMQIRPSYINSNHNVWRFHTAPFESTLKAGLPKGTRISSCVNVCLFTLAFVCVSCVCSALSPGTSAMPPLSQFLASLLKNMLIQTNLLFLLCSSLPSSSLGMDWIRHTTTANVHHPQPGCLIFLFLFWLYFTILNHLFPDWVPAERVKKLVNTKQLENSCFLYVILASQLQRECRIPDLMAMWKHGGSYQKDFHFTTISHRTAIAPAIDSSPGVTQSR